MRRNIIKFFSRPDNSSSEGETCSKFPSNAWHFRRPPCLMAYSSSSSHHSPVLMLWAILENPLSVCVPYLMSAWTAPPRGSEGKLDIVITMKVHSDVWTAIYCPYSFVILIKVAQFCTLIHLPLLLLLLKCSMLFWHVDSLELTQFSFVCSCTTWVNHLLLRGIFFTFINHPLTDESFDRFSEFYSRS